MEFGILIGSLLALVLVIWLISKYVRLVFFRKSEKSEVTSPAELEDEKQPSSQPAEEEMSAELEETVELADSEEAMRMYYDDDGETEYTQPESEYEYEYEYGEDENTYAEPAEPEYEEQQSPPTSITDEIKFGREPKFNLFEEFDSGGAAPETSSIFGDVPNIATKPVSYSEEPLGFQPELNFNQEFPNYQNSDDRVIDMIAWFPKSRDSFRRTDLLRLYRNLINPVERPHTVMGLSVETGEWINVHSKHAPPLYSDLILTMQLVYKGKPISEEDWWRFIQMVEHYSEKLRRDFCLSSSLEIVLEESKKLSREVSQLDLLAVLILKAEHGIVFSSQGASYLAREFGLKQQQGRFVYDKIENISGTQRYLFSIVPTIEENKEITQDIGVSPNLNALILCSNLNCVNDPEYAFKSMVDTAHDLQDRISVRLVDHNHVPIESEALGRINDYILEFVQNMKNSGFTPGSEVSIRLFGSSYEHTKPFVDTDSSFFRIER